MTASTPPRAKSEAVSDAPAALYLWGNSPFGYKVVMAAAHKGVPIESRVASLSDCRRAQRHTGKHKVPFLVAGDAWITDSTAICDWLESRDGGESLLPADRAARAECRLLEDWADEGLNKSAESWTWIGEGRLPRVMKLVVDEQKGVSRLLFRVMGGYIRRRWRGRIEALGGLEATRALLCSQLDLIEDRLAGRTWLFGEAATLADFAIAAQLANLVRLDTTADLDQRPATANMVRRACAALPWWRAR